MRTPLHRPTIPAPRHPEFEAFKDRVLQSPVARTAYQTAERRARRWTLWRRWRLVGIGLLIWTIILLLWATTPAGCGLSKDGDHVQCEHTGLLH